MKWDVFAWPRRAQVALCVALATALLGTVGLIIVNSDGDEGPIKLGTDTALTLPEDAASTARPQGGAPEDSRSDPATVAPDGRPPSAAASPAGSGSSTIPSPGATGRGFTGSQIRIGVLIPQGTAAVAEQFGVKGATSGDNAAQVAAAVKAVNASGGIAGREVVPIVIGNDLNNGTYSTQAESICTSWTQDAKVFAGVGAGFDVDTLTACMTKSQTPLVPIPSSAALPNFADEETLARFSDTLFWPSLLSSRHYGAVIDRWVASGFFRRSSRIGLIRHDNATFARVTEKVVKPALAAHGIRLTEEAAITVNNSVEGAGQVGGEVANAVLRFRASDVDRVFFMSISSGHAFLFMPQAESQGYRPRYGLTSFNMPEFLQNNVPKAQLVGAVGAGWTPTLDVAKSKAPGPAPPTLRCLDIMTKAGVELADRTAETYALSYCEALFFLQAALGRAPALSASGLRQGVESLGDGFASALVIQTRFGRGRHAGVSAFRDLSFESSCECFVYSGGSQALP